MEKQPHQEYRDELAHKLKDIRNSDLENPREAAQKHLSEQKEIKNGAYKQSKVSRESFAVIKKIYKKYITRHR